MKIQNLAIIAVIIILPLTLVLEIYTKTMAEVITTQLSYDNKLTDATYDAVQSMTMNYDANPSSSVITSQILDIEASINSFYNSLANQFVSLGINKNDIKNYVPAILYTSYDGYYIYTAFTNYLNVGGYEYDQYGGASSGDYGISSEDVANSVYQHGDTLYGLKPMTYYALRYTKGDADVYISYTLDSYITVNIKNGDRMFHQSGYILNDLQESAGNYTYNGYDIAAEHFIEYVTYYSNSDDYIYSNLSPESKDELNIEPNSTVETATAISANGSRESNIETIIAGSRVNVGVRKVYEARKVNGQMKYWTGERNSDGYYSVISFTSDATVVEQNGSNSLLDNYEERYNHDMYGNNPSALDFCQDSIDFMNMLKSNNQSGINVKGILESLTIGDAVDNSGNSITDVFSNESLTLYEMLFKNKDLNGIAAEDPGSNFYVHRCEVIQYIIEQDLKNAIATYQASGLGGYETGSGKDGITYQMPRIQATDWDKICNNVCFTTFLQGFNLGTKIYNNYCTIINTYTPEYVGANSIKLVTSPTVNLSSNEYYHEFYEEHLKELYDNGDLSKAVGILNTDLIAHTFERYFYWQRAGSTELEDKVSVDISASIYARPEVQCYNKTISSAFVSDDGSTLNYKQYFDNLENRNFAKRLGSIYYTSLFREKWSMYRAYNPLISVSSDTTFD